VVTRLAALGDGLVQLRTNPLRTSLTLLGVVFGVGSVVAMVSIGEGAERQVLAGIEAMGATSLHVRGSETRDQNLADLVNVSVGLSEADARALESILGVRDALAYRAQYGPRVTSLPVDASELKVHGVTASVFETLDMRVTEGRRLGPWDERDASPYAVLGADLAAQVFPEGALGRWFRIDYAWFQVVGVLAPRAHDAGGEGSGPAAWNRAIVITFPTLRETLEPPRTYGDLDQISIRLATIEATLPAKITAERVLGDLHGGARDYEVISPEELLRKREAAQRTLSMVLIAIAAISLVVGGIGVMNIMLANVTERVAEIGLRRAIGATRGDIVEQFLLESTTICVLGGALGTALGLGSAYVAASIMETPPVFAWRALVAAVVISLAVGLGAGLVPARRAAHLNPIEALRGE
jgi:putative ABC transport system permease protein